MTISRRTLLQRAAALAALAEVGWRPSQARAAAGERKFLFFFASGGWDTTTVFDPHHVSSGVDMDPDTYTEIAGGLTYTAGPDRPAVSRFFSRWGSRAAIVNGIDAHSVGHDSGTQFSLTGTSASSFPDWPTLLAAEGRGEYPLPHLVFSGPSLPGNRGGSVVRAGGGALLDLIDASIVGASDAPAPVMPEPADRLVDAFAYDRAARFAAARGEARSAALLANTGRSMEIEGRRFETGLSDLGSTLLEQSVKAAELMRLGLTRCAMIGIPGGWDSHGDETVQAPQFDDLFDALDQLLSHLAATPGLSTPTLIDEVTIVCLSEFGRTPLLNGGGGKDHWPFNSALLVGSGVNGGRVVGATDEGLIGVPIDFATGQPDDNGEIPGAENLGATLMKLGGLDPEDHLPGIPAVEALIR